jgi:glycosyltransferase involved in cell wall biosynthesis
VLTVAYLSNEYPSDVESYVGEEIEELRANGVRVVTGTVRRSRCSASVSPDIIVFNRDVVVLISALCLCVREWKRLAPIVVRILLHGKEWPVQRLKALLHTFLGACYAIMLRKSEVKHIHVHHGYFGSWIGMTAARLLGVGYSLTLHGSDLLLHGRYLDAKLERCSFCVTVSEFNRRYILQHYPHVDPRKIIVARLGVIVGLEGTSPAVKVNPDKPFTVVAVGRLHEVKNHAFLVRACARLLALDLPFECHIAGDGPERRALEILIRKCDLAGRVTLLGHVRREQMNSLYDRADLVVLTSRSEGIPVVLMEAMARGKLVLAPAITGVPELIIPGKAGFLYESGSMTNFLEHLLFIHSMVEAERIAGGRTPQSQALSCGRQLDWIRHAARVQVLHNFNRDKNLKAFARQFIERVGPQSEGVTYENPVLQQIQLPVQRNRSVSLRVDGLDARARP